MKTDVNTLINLMKKFTISEDKGEFSEQDAAAGGGGGTSSGGGTAAPYPTVTKWESGVTRGPANQIGLTKWKDIVKINRGKANTLL
jgi:hypothetical protein